MITIQSKWSKGNEIKDNGDIGQIVLDGNSVTFHIDGYGDPFARNFVGEDNSHYYKIYTSGQGLGDSTGFFYHVTKVFLNNGGDYKNFVGDKIEGITSFSFEIPELADWLKMQSVELLGYKDGSMIIHEKKITPIVINRAGFGKLIENLESYFEKWFSFSKDDKFTFLQDVFFHYNGKKNTNVDDLFLTYCNFLEGYDLRVTKDEEKANVLNDKLEKLLKVEEIKSVLSPVFIEAGSSSYKSKEIAKWVSTGFLERVSLKDRIKRLDNKYLQIIAANSRNIIETEDANEYYLKITKTRNYYSHFKQDNTGILSYEEMFRTLDLLEGLIVTILLSEMGIPIEDIKGFMIQDEKYWHLLSHYRADA